MKMIRVAVLVSVVASVLMGCPLPPPPPPMDGGSDAGFNPNPIDACSGGCDDSQICDVDGNPDASIAPRTCVTGCTDGCDAGTDCRRVQGSANFQCVPRTNTCAGSACNPGQTACVANECSCLVSARGTQDTCQGQGQWCRGKACGAPKRYEECVIGGAPCPTGEVCRNVFGSAPNEIALCLKDCSAGAAACDVGEQCAGGDLVACLPQGLFRGGECSQNIPQDGGFSDAGVPLPTDGGFVQLSDGGFQLRTVAVGNPCLVRGSNGAVTDNPGTGRGNCTYAGFKIWRFGFFPFDTCIAPGTAQIGQRCVKDFSAGNDGTRCATGLECAYTGGQTDGGFDEGICLKTCNANPSKFGFPSVPACGNGEACVNLYRYTDPDDNSVLGVCMKSCNVFSSMTSSCANLGATPTSCVPASSDGQLALSLTGDGICVPQQRSVANTGARCNETDPFRGAACRNGQVCSSNTLTDPATCIQVCDTSCVGVDGGAPPARCTTQPNATCPAGKSCRRASSTTGATVGYCL